MRTLLKKHFTLLLFFLPVFSFGQFIANYHKAGDSDINPPFISPDSLMYSQKNNLENLRAIENNTALHFDLNKFSIMPEMEKTLDLIVIVLKENPEIKLEVSSHSDSRGPAEYNLALTQRRSKSIFNYLISKGIGKERLLMKSLGETQLVNNCDVSIVCTEEMQKENRRVEFRIFYPTQNTFGKF